MERREDSREDGRVRGALGGGEPSLEIADIEERFEVRADAEETRPRDRGGLKIERRFTVDAQGNPVNPEDTVEWVRRSSAIRASDGSVIFEMQDIEVPASWSTVAGDVLASKYMRKTGVPQLDAEGKPILDAEGQPVLGSETSLKQVVRRMVKCWRHWGERYGYFASSEDAQNFEEELAYMLYHQYAAPNSPQWFNTGLHLAYGLSGPAQGHYYVDPESGEVRASEDAYSRPQPHACFILSVEDDLVNPGGIMDLWTREARLFKYGSGTGTNFSKIRGEGEPLSGGGVSSGLMSFLKIGDRAAGAIKSGGTTRRAAKMVCLDVDHPDIEAFVRWKAEEEKKAALLMEAGYSGGLDGEAYATVSGQNSNNSVRASDEFLRAVLEDREWHLRRRTDKQISKTLRARDLWKQICEAAWRCADPGIQFDTTINAWHTCPASGRINASNPCSEYMFLDNTACNLASLNLVKFYDAQARRFDVEAFRHACRLWTVVLEISVLMAQFPSREIARLSYEFRTLGLGYANLGSLLMLWGVPYDSEEGRAIAGAITAIMTGEAYATSAEMAREFGPFPRFRENREHMLRVIRNHRRAAYNAPRENYEALSVAPQGLNAKYAPAELVDAARRAWDRALDLGDRYGYRNAQTTAIAPTGTIGLLMDCDTTGIEPDFALVKFKKLAGGGFFKIANRSVEPALRALGYTEEQTADILRYLLGANTLEGAPYVNRKTLKEKGFQEEELERVEAALPKFFDLAGAFSEWTLGEACLRRLGFQPEDWRKPGFSILEALGFSAEEIAEATLWICGRHTLEGAPWIREEHLPVFDCASRCGKHGTRLIRPGGHIRMMAAVQPFVSGAISKTINLPHEATVQDVSDAYLLSWKLGIKATSIYRDGCKLAQPLSTRSDGQKASKSGCCMEERSGKRGSERAPQGQEARPSATAARSPQAARENPAGSSAPSPRTRRPLPSKRHGFTQEASVCGHKIYLRTGEYEDGTLGEIFIDMHKEGATFRCLMNCFAIAISKGLQYGVPLEEFVETFTFTRFAPNGVVRGHPYVKAATSIVDYVFRVLGLEYLGRTDLVQVKPCELGEHDPAEKDLRAQLAQHLHSDAGHDPGAESAKTARSKGSQGGGPNAESRVAVGEAARAELPRIFGDGEDGQEGSHGRGDTRSTRARRFEPTMGRFQGLDRSEGNWDEGLVLEQFAGLLADAPLCHACGQVTVRSGTCYRCVYCGEAQGCS